MTVAEPRDAALDAAIVEDPEDPARYAVYGDWLAERGDPRGELIALSLAHEAARRKDTKKRLAAKIEALRAREHERFAGGALAAHAKNHDGYGGNPFTWKHGFIDSACIRCAEPDPARPADVVRDVLDHPSGRFLIELHVNHERAETMIDVQPVIDLIAARGKTLRDLRISDSNLWERYVHVGSFARAWRGLAGLRALRLAGDFALGAITLPHAEVVSLANPAWTRDHAHDLGLARWPALRDFTLELAGVPEDLVGAFVWALTQLPATVRRIAVTRTTPGAREAIEAAVAGRQLDKLAIS